MGKRRSFEERARAEVERIKAADAEEEARFRERLEELKEQAATRRREEEKAAAEWERVATAERDRRAEQEARRRERAEKETARRAWIADGGSEAAFEEAWPKLRDEARSRRVMDADARAREAHRRITLGNF